MNSPADDIRKILENSPSDSGFSLTFRTNLFVSQMPESPNRCVAIYDSGGYHPTPNYVYDYPTIQIMVRGNKFGYVDAYNLSESIKRYLHGKQNVIIDLTRYILILAQGDIISLGQDDNNRPILSCNFLIHRTE